MMKISVIIPVYNTRSYVRACVDSILSQTLKPWEIILVDDGSTDDSGAICDELASAHEGLVRTIHQENGGIAVARNRGLSVSTGDYLSFIDSDDYLEPDTYEHLAALAEEFDADMAVGEMLVEKLDGQRYCRMNKPLRCCWNTEEALVELNSYRTLHVSFCPALIRRAAMGDMRFPEVRICEDYALMYRMVAACRRVAYSSRPLYHYVQRPKSVSRTVHITLAPMDVAAEQVRFFQERFPHLIHVARADYAFAHISIYTAYARSGQQCPGDLLARLRREAWRNLGAVLRCRRLPWLKKAQAMVFCLSPGLYRRLVAGTEHR
ncbi:MAG: glycosyltransferase family 2 protein [Aristaeellaceae bacterium]